MTLPLTPIVPGGVPLSPLLPDGRGIERINARRYLLGNGLSESSAAVAGLLADAAGKALVFPPGQYRLPNVLFPNSTRVIGSGASSVILSSGDTHCFNFQGAYDCSIENLWFDGITASEAVNGNASSNLQIAGCDFHGCLIALQFGATALDPVVFRTRVRNSTSTVGSQGAIYLANVQRGKFLAVDVTDSAGNGYFLGDAADTKILYGEVSRNGGTTGGRRGINFGTGGTAPRVLIGFLHMDSNAEQAVYCSTNSPDGKIVHCVMLNHNGANVSDSGTIELSSSGWVVDDTDVENSGGSVGNPVGVFIGGADIALRRVRVRNSNGRGISVWGANDAQIDGCRVKNSGKVVGNAAIFISNGSLRPIVVGNRCYDDQGTPTQTYGLETSASVDRMVFDANNLVGNKLAATSLADTNRATGSNITA